MEYIIAFIIGILAGVAFYYFNRCRELKSNLDMYKYVIDTFPDSYYMDFHEKKGDYDKTSKVLLAAGKRQQSSSFNR